MWNSDKALICALNNFEAAGGFVQSTTMETTESIIIPSVGASNSKELFTTWDYGCFAALVAVSGLIGIYYGFISKRKQDNPEEYILGNKEMSVIPIAASLVVSQISGVSMLAVPADIYFNGTQYVMCVICIGAVAASLIYVFIPVFYDLNCPSIFVYLERRFDRKVRLTASLVYTVNSILFMPIIVYMSALAFNQVSGINIHYVTVVLTALCIFYTALGGLRAVVWTDAIQYVSIMGSIVAVTIVGTVTQGGVGNVFDAAERGGRLILFDMTPNPFVRSSFWTVGIGMSVMWVALISASQGTIQRFLSLPSKRDGTKCVLLFCLGFIIIKLLTVYLGMLLFAEYENCDPLAAGLINKIDQILPYYSLNIFKNFPGLSGVFIAGIFAGALSSMSSILNTLAGSIFEDFIKPSFKSLAPKTVSNIMKLIVCSLGLLTLSAVFLVGRLGAIMELAYSVHGLTAGASFGIFAVGMFSRTVNTKGIISGAIAAMICVGMILLGAHMYVKAPPLPFSTEGCDFPNNGSVAKNNWIKRVIAFEDVPWLFRISFMYYALIGIGVLLVVAYPVSILTGGCGEVDERLLAPFMRHSTGSVKEMKFMQVPTKAPDGEEKKGTV